MGPGSSNVGAFVLLSCIPGDAMPGTQNAALPAEAIAVIFGIDPGQSAE